MRLQGEFRKSKQCREGTVVFASLSWLKLAMTLLTLSLTACKPYYQTLKVVGYRAGLMVNGEPRSYGHSEKKLGHGWYRVQVLGHANAPQVWLRRIAEARAAELTLNNKQTYFLVEAVDTQINCAFDIIKHERRNKKKKQSDEDRRYRRDAQVVAVSADRIVYMTIRIAGNTSRPGLRHAQQVFGQELKVLAGAQPHAAEKQVAYEEAMSRCRIIARDREYALNNRNSIDHRRSWTERVTVPH